MTQSICLIGHGAWGKKIEACFQNSFPKISLLIASKENYLELAHQADGVIIATQPELHISIALEILSEQIDKPLLIEKPLSLKTVELTQLEILNPANVIVDYIHLFSSAFDKIYQTLEVDRIIGVESVGRGQGPIRSYSSLWDYGVHDLAMSIWLTRGLPLPFLETRAIQGDGAELFTFNLAYQNFDHKVTTGNFSPDVSRIRDFVIKLKRGKSLRYYRDFESGKDILLKNDKEQKISSKSALENSIQNFLNLIDGKENVKRPGLAISQGIDSLVKQLLA